MDGREYTVSEPEDIQLEPSALAGMVGPIYVQKNTEYRDRQGFTAKNMRNATHLVWATGGGMVPATEMKKYLATAQ